MALLKNVLGLDLGSHSVKAVEVHQTLRGFETVALRTLPRRDEETNQGPFRGVLLATGRRFLCRVPAIGRRHQFDFHTRFDFSPILLLD